MSPLASWWVVLCCVGVVVWAIWLAESRRPACTVCHGPLTADDVDGFCSSDCALAYETESVDG